jgi:nucleotide-binding universal stress UspA family protein
MHSIQSILLATDFRPASLDAADVAVELAAAFGARLTLFHVFQPFGLTKEVREEERAVADWQMQELAQQLTRKYAAVSETLVTPGHPVDRIVRKAQEMEADLVLIGAGKWTRQEREPFSPGPVAEAVLQHARQPVLVVRPGAPAVRFRKILCPVDQSPASARALQTAVTLARAFDGALHVVTVVPGVSWLAAASETGRFAGALAEHKRHWKQEFEQFLARTEFAGVPWRREIRHGVPHEEIAASAREHWADLIVMGSTGRTGLARLLLGSVARRLLQELPCSVLSVKEEEPLEPEFDEDLAHIHRLLAQGRELFAAGDYGPALLKFRQVLGYNPFHAGALEAQAEAYERLGERKRAEGCRRRAKKALLAVPNETPAAGCN